MGMSYTDLGKIQTALTFIPSDAVCLFTEDDLDNNQISQEVKKRFLEINKPFGIKMMELGNATLKPKDETGTPSPGKDYRKMAFDRIPAKKYFTEIGVMHTSIDLNGNDGALEYDLGDLKQSEKFSDFDIVTNFGTSEHVKHHYECFANIHNFCATNGVFVHSNPTTNFWTGHLYCFRWYSTEFFEELCEANGYEVIDICEFGSRDHDFVKTHCSAKKINDDPFISREQFKKIEEKTYSK